MAIIRGKRELSRRKFVKYSSSALLGAPLIIATPGALNYSRKADLTCKDIADHFAATETGKTINWDKTTDTFKAGDPSKKVTKIAVAWKASWDALREAVDRGADMFISHESICVHAQNGSKEQEVVFALPSEKPKFEWLEKTGLVVFRCHDVWDRFPEIGIRDAWQKGLKIGDKIYSDEYPYLITEVAPVSVGELAKHILKLIKPLGQNGIMVSGNQDKIVRRIGTGTGVNTDPVRLKNLGADVGIMTDDYYLHVRMGVHANELDFPAIIVNHGVTEEWAFSNLAGYVRKVFPDIDVFHIPQYCPYKIIT